MTIFGPNPLQLPSKMRPRTLLTLVHLNSACCLGSLSNKPHSMPAQNTATPLVWLDIVKNEILQESQKTNSARNWPTSPFFPLHPISLCLKVLIPSSNLWRASPTPFRASKKVKNWQNITFSWTGECTHTQFLCLYGDNWHIITIQKEENLLSHKKIHSLFSGSAYHNPQILI